MGADAMSMPPLPPGFTLDSSGAPPLPPGFTLDEPSTAANIFGGVIRGAGSIGATVVDAATGKYRSMGLLKPVDREAMDAGLTSLIGSDPNSLAYQGGKIGTEFAGTLAIPGALSGVAKSIPALSKFAPLLERGGFGAGSTVAKVTTGATTGAATTAAIDPESIGTGAIIGASVPMLLGIPGRFAAKGAGYLHDLVTGKLYKVNAGRIMREVAGDELNAVRAANEIADPSLLASQSAEGTPAYQATIRMAEQNDVSGAPIAVRARQAAINQAAVDNLAGGTTQTAQTATRKAAKSELNKITKPLRETALDAANMAGQKLPRLNAKIDAFGNAASDNVTDVGRFTAAGERASARANTSAGFQGGIPGLSRIPARYSYFSELAAKADEVAQGAADDSLILGAARRDAQYAADSLAAHGLKPLDVNPLLNQLDATIASPVVRVSGPEKAALSHVADLLRQETASGRVMDVRSLYKIRQDGINQAVSNLNPGMDAKAQRKLAASLLIKLKPTIDKAIVDAGGGPEWKQYLETYAAGMTLDNQAKLAMRLSKAYKDSPKAFIDLVSGNNIKEIEKAFGPGAYDVMAEMGAKIRPLKAVSDYLVKEKAIKKAAEGGAVAAARVLNENMLGKRLPGFLSPKITVANSLIKELETKVNKKTLESLVQGARSGKAMNEVLNTLPALERNNILNYMMTNPRWQSAFTTTAAVGGVQ